MHSLVDSIRKEGFLYYYLIPLIITNVALIFYNYLYYTNIYFFTVSIPYWLLLFTALNLIIAYLGPDKKNRVLKQTQVLMNYENLDEKINKLLTQKEQEVLQLLLQQKTNKEISKLLYVGIRTVESYLYNIKEKLDLPNVKELRKFILAYKNKLNTQEQSSKK
ncbi:MAG: response regulator transcription factor [Melioribacter sp.]|nr:response regulator transcription factor [Melioribacter sp.]